MGVLDLPDEAVKRAADAIFSKVKLQNWCASGFPYCCTGVITVQEGGGASCDCGASTVSFKEGQADG